MLLYIDGVLIMVNMYFALKRKQNIFLEILTGAYIWTVISGYHEGVDIFAYINDYYNLMYNGISMFESDIGYYLLQYYFVSLGVDYITFKQILTFIAVTFMMVSIRKLSTNRCMIYAYYLSYQLVLDTIQFRNFVGFTIFLYGLTVLIHAGENSRMKYLVFIFIATMFHTAMILYSLLVLKEKKVIVNLLFYIFILLTIITVLNGFQIPFVQEMVAFDRASSYMGGGDGSSVAFLLPVITLISYYAIMCFIKKENNNKTVESTINMYKLAMFSIPLCCSSFQWYRLIRNINIFSYAIIDNNNTKYIIGVWMLVLLLLWGYCDFFRFISIDNVMTVFDNNLYFDGTGKI